MASRTARRFLSGLILFCASSSAFAAGPLTWSGDLATARAYMVDLAKLYQARENVVIELKITSTSSAISKTVDGSVDMGGSARGARPQARSESMVTYYPVAWDALVVITHPDSQIRNITLLQLQGILRGEITNWSALGGPDAGIKLYVDSDVADGVNYNIKEIILGSGMAETPTGVRMANAIEVEKAVMDDRFGISISTYSSARRRSVNILALETIPASQATIRSGTYLLYQPMYLTFKENSTNRRQVRQFLRFAQTSRASRVLRRNGVVPYTDSMELISRRLEQESSLRQLLGF